MGITSLTSILLNKLPLVELITLALKDLLVDEAAIKQTVILLLRDNDIRREIGLALAEVLLGVKSNTASALSVKEISTGIAPKETSV